ncbi:hypothetical protein HPB51_026607 [Rhipicephalus microplus]|uniref:Uncharacterized protein n=1 Tax=Rhipicephalus microplus TaxID=6941 RepID=A0A9J6D2K2_RHIMP|nr:hypothetical protein HPB51_026607 [Rhipicephalus microplus]
MRLHYGTEKDDEKTPGSQHVPGPQTPHTTLRTDPTTPTTNGTTPNIGTPSKTPNGAGFGMQCPRSPDRCNSR